MVTGHLDDGTPDVDKLDDLHNILLDNVKVCNDLAVFLLFESRYGTSLGSLVSSRPAKQSVRIKYDRRWFGESDAKRLAKVVNTHARAEHLYHESCNIFLPRAYSEHFGSKRPAFKGRFEASSYHQFAMLYCEVITKEVLKRLDQPQDDMAKGASCKADFLACGLAA